MYSTSAGIVQARIRHLGQRRRLVQTLGRVSKNRPLTFLGTVEGR